MDTQHITEVEPKVIAGPWPRPTHPAGDAEQERWFELVHPLLVDSNVHLLAATSQLIKAKHALRCFKGSFLGLLVKLGLDADKAERLMRIARHPVLADSAHARNLPTSWMTQYTLAALQPDALLTCLRDGRVHPRLQRREAELLVRQIRGSNSRKQNKTATVRNDITADHLSKVSNGITPEADREDGEAAASSTTITPASADVTVLPAAQALTQADDIGPHSRLETAHRLARAEELEREVVRLSRQVVVLERELAELSGKISAEQDVPHQRRLFRRAVTTAKKADTVTPKEARCLLNSIAEDVVELARSAERDGIGLDRLDLYCCAELH